MAKNNDKNSDFFAIFAIMAKIARKSMVKMASMAKIDGEKNVRRGNNREKIINCEWR